MLISIYLDLNKGALLENVFDELIAIYAVAPEELGNIYYHKALLQQVIGKDAETILASIKLSEDCFRKIFKEDHYIYENISSLINSIKDINRNIARGPK